MREAHEKSSAVTRSLRLPGTVTHGTPTSEVQRQGQIAGEPRVFLRGRVREPLHAMALQQSVGNHVAAKLFTAATDVRGMRVTPAAMVGVARQPDTAPDTRTLSAPPPKDSQPTAARIAALTSWLTAHMAGHAMAVTTYTFYEVIDDYLGPWGERGYPLAYGKHYNVLFSTNRQLMGHPVASAWVWRTTILLQQALVDFIVGRYRAGTLGRLTEAEFRTAAFASHPRAYTQGGLDVVALVAPELIPVIASIPGVEFLPTSENFGESLTQVAVTASMVAPRMLGNLLAAAVPAHSGMLRIAVQRDQRRLLAELQLNRYLIQLRGAIVNGELNNIQVLNQVTHQLLGHEFPDQGMARVAREVIQVANQRKVALAQEYAAAIRSNPRLRPIYDRFQPGWEVWLQR